MKTATKIIFSFLILALCFIGREIARSPKSDQAEVNFLDVGQGDSALIQKGNYQILIDGGPDAKVLAELGKVMPLSDRTIEKVILTHPHADHLAGLNEVLEHYEVKEIIGTGVTHTSDGYLHCLSTIKKKKINFRIPKKGDAEKPFADGELVFLWPGDDYQGKSVDNLNDSSIAARFCYFAECTLFLGDMESAEQGRMMEYYKNDPNFVQTKLAILKVAHHGSSNGVNEQLYSTLLPKYSVISVGVDNQYGHPHSASLEMAKKYDSVILRTDRDGTIKFLLSQDGIVLTK